MTLDIQDAKGNQYVQNKQVERFISLGCDTLCVNPVDRTTSSGIIDAAAAADIPVVFFNRQPVEEDMDPLGQALLCWCGCQRIRGAGGGNRGGPV